jgi:hypothetical protein
VPPPPSPRILPHLEAEERERAVAAPGPSWSQWFYFSFAKVWTLLAFFILDVFVLGTLGLPPYQWTLGPALAAAVFAEFVLYEYLWHRPTPEQLVGFRKGFHRTWYRPFAYGRWTIEGERARAGTPLLTSAEEPHPDPRDFL